MGGKEQARALRRGDGRGDCRPPERGRLVLAQHRAQQDDPHEGESRVKAAKKWIAEVAGEEKKTTVLSSWGPYTSTIGQVYKKNDLSLPAVSTAAKDSTAGGGVIAIEK